MEEEVVSQDWLVIASWGDRDHFKSISTHAGRKTRGLMLVPSAWSVPFVSVLAKDDVERNEARSSYELLTQDSSWRGYLHRLLQLADRYSSVEKLSVLLRPDIRNSEFHCDRGLHTTKLVEATFEAVCRGIDELFDISGEIVGVIVQPCVQPNITGHISNERRISLQREMWLVEATLPGSHDLSQRRIRASENFDHTSELICGEVNSMIDRLRDAAGFFRRVNSGRFHCEWVWNGKQLWIVQADEVPESAYVSAGRYTSNLQMTSNGPLGPLKYLKHISRISDNRWRKLNRPRLFSSLGFPTPELYQLGGDLWMHAAESDHQGLLVDFSKICGNPVVIRTDVTRDSERDNLFLPVSDPTLSHTKLLEFMTRAASAFSSQEIPSADWTFILANVVPAIASVLVYATPRSQAVRIDALWGYPDGLQYYPHDSYTYSMREKSVNRKIRFKSACLGIKSEGWESELLEPPLDWERVLTDADVATFASYAHKLSSELSKEVQLIGLVQEHPISRFHRCLPWYFTTLEILSEIADSELLVPPTGVTRVESPRDLDSLDRAPERLRKRGLLLVPSPSHVRDRLFLSRAAKLARSTNQPLYFEGSLLGHAFYIMREYSDIVIPVGTQPSHQSPTVHDKIVRDLIPAIIEDTGSIAHVFYLSKSEAILRLKQKLVEEALEVLWADSDQLAEELADTLEVLQAIGGHSGIDADMIQTVRKNKRLKRGGFDQLLFLRETRPREIVESLTQDTTTVPLLFDSIHSHQDRTTSPRKWYSFGFDRSRRSIASIRLPLVPPIKKGVLVKREIAESASISIEIQYASHDVSLRIRDADNSTQAIDQLSLDFEMEGEVKRETR